MIWRQKLQLVLGALCINLACFGIAGLLPVQSQGSVGWEAYIRPRVLDHWLNFPSSSTHPIVWSAISYTIPESNNRSEKPYEDLFYSSDTAIGLQQRAALAVPAETAGVIHVLAKGSDELTPGEEKAAAGAIARLTLDLYLKKCPIIKIIVPSSAFKSIILGLYKYGFHQSPSLNMHASSPMMMYTEINSDNHDQAASLMVQM